MKAEPRNYVDLTDLFEARDLDARSFTHRDHIGVACQMLQRYDFLDAAARYGSALKDIAANAGAAGKFNTTVTLAFLGILAERMEVTAHENFDEFLVRNPDLFSRSLMDTWYSSERVSSATARQVFLLPDRFKADRSAEPATG
ncbi:hypothetical protein [uncultured Roseibium sp.]|uniref:hypothetical protein n=1 Tax=uncultured Roseibium sp. TaxID=1936171 RepID=UPI00260D8B22|nr:hypothetical protein [uncultured Roseibium sp.]